MSDFSDQKKARYIELYTLEQIPDDEIRTG